MAEESCWAITQAAGWSCCQRSGSSLLDLDFKWTPLYTHVFGHMHIQLRPVPDLPEVKIPVSWGVSINKAKNLF